MHSFFAEKTGFWNINGPKLGCIGDTMNLLFAADR